MSDGTNELFLKAFLDGNVEQARTLAARLPPHKGLTAHPMLREFVTRNSGHCYKKSHLQIADLLTPDRVRRFRDAVLADQVDEVRSQLDAEPQLVDAQFCAGRGISQPIHHFSSIAMGELLLNAGADIHAQTTVHHNGETPLGMQVRFGTVEAVRFLLQRGADPDVSSQMHMPSDQMETLIPLLLEHGWDIHCGNQLLHDANHGHGSRIATWLEFGVDPNTANPQGSTALHLLAARGTGREAIERLVEAGADLQRRDKFGRTPLDLAKSAKRQTAYSTIKRLLNDNE